MTRKDNILSQQNPILKVFISIMLVIISSISNFNNFLMIFGFTFLYFLAFPKIYLIWFKTLLKIIPFFISLFIFGIIFQTPFLNQCVLSARIIYLLLISVYLTQTTTIDSIISVKEDQNSNFILKFKFFIAATVHFIPILITKFKYNIKTSRNLINAVVASMEDCLKDIHEVELTVTEKIRVNFKSKKRSFWADAYLLILVVFPILIVLINSK
ncbi:MAG: hypothetical protein HOD64_12795 [Candidatus Cloacimonetes bacterium]|nr:hypothetical protein [Candidatus Cloacimonadota bacterium]MBT4574946.1 hypothetical protein [Candidatus Cloacimonadota bacterium]